MSKNIKQISWCCLIFVLGVFAAASDAKKPTVKDIPPRPVYTPDPEYTSSARHDKIQGDNQSEIGCRWDSPRDEDSEKPSTRSRPKGFGSSSQVEVQPGNEGWQPHSRFSIGGGRFQTPLRNDQGPGLHRVGTRTPSEIQTNGTYPQPTYDFVHRGADLFGVYVLGFICENIALW